MTIRRHAARPAKGARTSAGLGPARGGAGLLSRPSGLVTSSRVVDHGLEDETIDESLLDIVDHVLTKGVVLTGDLMLGVADIDLVYLRLSAVLCAADRLFGGRGAAAPTGAPSPPKRAKRRSRAG